MLKLLKKINKKEIMLILISILFISFQVYLDLKIPDFMANITEMLQKIGTKVNELFFPGVKMILCAFGSLASSIIVGYFASYIASSLSKRLRKEVFSKTLDFSQEEIHKYSVNSLITRTTNDITHIGMFVSMGLQLIIKAPITAVWAITKIANKNLYWTLATGASVLILLLIITIIITCALPKFKIIQKLTDNLNRIVRENLKGIRVVRAYNAYQYQKDKFNKANTELTNTNLFTSKIMGILSPSISLIMNTLSLSIYFIGSLIIEKSILTLRIELFSNMIVFTSYAMQVVMSFMMMAIIFVIYPRASISANRVIEVLNTNTKIKDGSIKENTKEKGTIEFKNVSFKYPDAEEYVIKNINLKINKGQTVAFIGSTGCGKSTIINLIPRFYDASEGEVLVDGINVKDYEKESLYKKLGYVSQSAVIFSGKIKENVCYGNKKISDDKMKEAIDIAQAKKFVLNLDNKYDQYIARGGTNISGGQKQRLSIARAIAKNPEIYIFDDSFSALDYKTDYELRKSLKKYTKDATILIVAQRIGTIKDADIIVVIDSGKCVGMGKHKELLKKCKVYKEIALSQLSMEELENA